MNDQDQSIALELTAQIVMGFVSRNPISTNELPALIASTHAALIALGGPATAPVPEVAAPVPKVSERKSIRPDHLISMIDGRPYKMLKRHLSINGYTPETYRSTFGLSASYPMVAQAYAAQRRELALKIGLGRKSTH